MRGRVKSRISAITARRTHQVDAEEMVGRLNRPDGGLVELLQVGTGVAVVSRRSTITRVVGCVSGCGGSTR